MKRILASSILATWYAILGTICLWGLVALFWSLESGFDRPLRDLPRFDFWYLLGTPIVGFTTLWTMVFVLDWKKRRNPSSPSSQLRLRN